jgi:NADPH:quinone reductase-like Zn-dependent oxidoreductase
VRAVGLSRPGAPLEALELAVPEPAAGELLVRVIASSINPVDGYIAGGTYGSGELTYPVVPGRDVCGVVERLGEGVTAFAPGDRVLGCWTRPQFRLGAWAEYLAIGVDSAVTRWPSSLSAEHAAALPLAAATAQLAVDALAPVPGEPLLIVGAGGAVGCYAVQLAAARGARVIATAKAAEARRIRALGAAETIDYTGVDVAAAVRELHPDGIPALFDIVNDKRELLRLAELVHDGGRVASARFAADKSVLGERTITPINVLANGRGAEVLAPVLALAEAGGLQVLVSDVQPLEQLPAVVPQFARGGRGKIVVEVR